MKPRERLAVIDIGSNSVRLVIFCGVRRVPDPIFNEKFTAGLGADLGETGELSRASMDRALAALRRFRLLLEHIGIRRVHTVATAAVRDARNGADFVRQVRRIGLECRVLSEEEEARLGGLGVLASILDADGIVGDLGGGSLELVDIAGGEAREGLSVPLGLLRVDTDLRGEKAARKILRQAIADSGIGERAEGRCFYMVGGAWRALTRAHMLATGFPLLINHQYCMDPAESARLRKLIADPDPAWGKVIDKSRMALLPQAAMILSLVVEELRPSHLVVSSFGIREGLLYSQLPAKVRGEDPLIAAIERNRPGDGGLDLGGGVLDQWLGAIFDDPPEWRRIRLAACDLVDVARRANPAFRADRSIELALHSNWAAITADERVMLAQALCSSFGKKQALGSAILDLCEPEELARAHHWGLAMRLAQKLCAGAGSVLQASRLEEADGQLRLVIPRAQEPLVNEAVKRRLGDLAFALDLLPSVVVR